MNAYEWAGWILMAGLCLVALTVAAVVVFVVLPAFADLATLLEALR